MLPYLEKSGNNSRRTPPKIPDLKRWKRNGAIWILLVSSRIRQTNTQIQRILLQQFIVNFHQNVIAVKKITHEKVTKNITISSSLINCVTSFSCSISIRTDLDAQLPPSFKDMSIFPEEPSSSWSILSKSLLSFAICCLQTCFCAMRWISLFRRH